MSLATTFDEKVRIINDIWSKMSPDEKKLMLKRAIKDDIKAFFETIWDEQKFLEKEAGIDGAELLEYTSEKAWNNGEEVDPNDTGLEVNLAGKVSREAENAYYFDHKKKLGNDKFDGFLGYVNSSGSDDENRFKQLDETVLEPDPNMIEEVKDVQE